MRKGGREGWGEGEETEPDRQPTTPLAADIGIPLGRSAKRELTITADSGRVIALGGRQPGQQTDQKTSRPDQQTDRPAAQTSRRTVQPPRPAAQTSILNAQTGRLTV